MALALDVGNVVYLDSSHIMHRRSDELDNCFDVRKIRPLSVTSQRIKVVYEETNVCRICICTFHVLNNVISLGTCFFFWKINVC